MVQKTSFEYGSKLTAILCMIFKKYIKAFPSVVKPSVNYTKD